MCLFVCGITEIVDFVEFLSPSIEEQDVRDSAVQRVFEVANYIWPNCKVKQIASMFLFSVCLYYFYFIFEIELSVHIS